MKLDVLSPHQLTSEQLGAWKQLQAENPATDSPFFHPGFTQAVNAVRNDVEVAVLKDAGQITGFFPYQRDARNVGRPVGGYLSDFQGLIIQQETDWSATELVRRCDLRAWHFDHLLVSQSGWQRFHWLKATSPYMDLSEGFDAYKTRRCKRTSDELTQALRKARKVQREIGPIRFEPYSTDSDVLKTLIGWKVEQYRRLQVFNYLGPEWVVELLKRLVALSEDAFRGMLSALYIGDHLAAVHFGLRSHGVLHSWVTTYDVSLSKYSPGLILLLEFAKSAQSLGIRRIDLGKGPEQYKTQFMSGATEIAEGSVDLRAMTAAIRRGWRCTRELVRASPLRAPAQYVIRNARAWWIYR
ncbi:MAG: GNAT family N-acetyltransferase [Planctomycetes bacterium]|nr:GNAT family N-acetyltransferase [Planctomycetota bacterium]